MTFGALAVVPSVATTGGLIIAVVVVTFLLAFLWAQRQSGRAPPEVEDAHRQATSLEQLATELRSLREQTAAAGAASEALREIDETLSQVDHAGATLKRAAERA